MKFPHRKELIEKRVIYFFLVAFVAAFQLVCLRFGRCRPYPAAALVFVIAMFERAVPSMLYAAFAGIVMDSFSVSFDGIFAVSFTLFAFTVSMLLAFRLRRGIKTALLVLPAPVCLVFLIEWLLRYVIRGEAYSGHILAAYFLPSAVVSCLFVPLFYFIVQAFENRFAGGKR